MGEKITVALDARAIHGKKVAILRREGIVPVVVYGPGFEPVSAQVNQQIIDKVARVAGKHHAVHITVDGKKRIAMIKDIDIDPVKHVIRHVSFHAVNQNEAVTADIPIKLIGEGESAAERAGLVVLQTLEILEVKALPMSLPNALNVSILDLTEAGDTVTVGDITLDEGVEFGDVDQDLALVIASVYEPGALQAANEALGGVAEDVSEVAADNGADTPQGGEDEEENPGGKKAKEDHGE
ncbi:MAG: 50S ribosomal protein L25 [Microcoleus sp.]